MTERQETTLPNKQGDAGGGIHRAIRLGVLVLILFGLFVTNPSEAQIKRRISADGWMPIKFERTNLFIFSCTSIKGVTGANGLYVGIAGQVFNCSGK